MKDKKEVPTVLTDRNRNILTIVFWSFSLIPFLFVSSLLLFQSEDDLPPVEMLDNPPELQASIVYAADGKTELGKYWKVNRNSVKYREISPFVIDALISTEDERFHEHSGVDFQALGRAVVNIGGAGGASTITQQLAKLLFTLQEREREELIRANGGKVKGDGSGRIGRMLKRLNEKARENIIAIRLEKRFTKEEIITMYLNQFDFLYNAVGIENAAKVYFNKKPIDLNKEEAAVLVGMCKNPTLYNPYAFKIKNYRIDLANKNKVKPETITLAQISSARASDSLRAVARRNQVLMQWLKNSEAGNEALRVNLTQAEYDVLKNKPLVVNYQLVDHKEGIAPYFRESLRKEITSLLLERKSDGSYKYARADGSPYDIYRDGLKIYTTIDSNLQAHAEEAMKKHLQKSLQKEFDKNNRNLRNFPFSNDISKEEVDKIMRNARLNSLRYEILSKMGYSEYQIVENFNTPVQMRVFTWNGEKDTVLTPNDSIRYYKSFLHAGLISIEPQTGFVRAWVGGADFKHFAFDHVRQGKRQIGSTVKPFVYATAMHMGTINPCTSIPNITYCVDLVNSSGIVDDRWCPKNAGGSGAGSVSATTGLAQSMNNITVAVMAKMGGYSGPKTISKFLKEMDIFLTPDQEVPALCLGIMDLSLFELVGAQCIFANGGRFNKPTTILRIEDRHGNTIYTADNIPKQVYDPTVAYETLLMMKKVVTQGTAGSLRGGQPWGNVLAPTAGKTGTTQSNSDGWFVGLTPELVTGVWVGAEDRSVRFRSMTWGQGARMALPIYGYYMQKVYKDPKIGLATTDFERPEGYDPAKFRCSGANNGMSSGNSSSNTEPVAQPPSPVEPEEVGNLGL
jgi:penicillin-binding protein 1A